MNIESAVPTVKNPPEQFHGDVWLDRIATPHEADQRMTVALVRFAPGARTAWHSHARGQFLRVTSGVALVGDRDGNVVELHPGRTLYTPPGQDHWHGATADCFMEHLAMLEAGDDPATTTVWKEHVTDAEYARRRAE
ncbi:cupin domain-containing protein [Microbacterium azadirachtae]|uniref:Cupin domain protein n=1 Tax=Microbacterium azadirachtae TaxID=582680 RepID=A0A0F0LNG8_9MICO|nr:cupin domain-containing protein [Microbacterium azadirachtae]KJL34224.1 Cupin domain protein [Microbacterium azadirachtae]